MSALYKNQVIVQAEKQLHINNHYQKIQLFNKKKQTIKLKVIERAYRFLYHFCHLLEVLFLELSSLKLFF